MFLPLCSLIETFVYATVLHRLFRRCPRAARAAEPFAMLSCRDPAVPPASTANPLFHQPQLAGGRETREAGTFVRIFSPHGHCKYTRDFNFYFIIYYFFQYFYFIIFFFNIFILLLFFSKIFILFFFFNFFFYSLTSIHRIKIVNVDR